MVNGHHEQMVSGCVVAEVHIAMDMLVSLWCAVCIPSAVGVLSVNALDSKEHLE